MKSRFWNTWNRDEPKVRSSAIVLKDREDKSVRVVAEESRKNNRKNGIRLIDRFSPIRNGKSRINGHDKRDKNHDEDDDVDDDNDDDDDSSGYREDNDLKWKRETSRFNDDPRRRKSRSTVGTGTNSVSISATSDNHDRCTEARLTNGKSRMTVSNGVTKQVKRTDELSLGSLERERRGVNFEIDDDDDHEDDDDDDDGDNKHNLYDSEVNGNCEPIKFVRRFDEFEYNKRDPTKDSKLINRNKLHNKHNNYKEYNRNNGDSLPRRSTSARQEFIYFDKRSRRYGDDDEHETRSPDRGIEYPSKDSNGRHLILTNGSRRSRSGDQHRQHWKSGNKSNVDDSDHVQMKSSRYDRNRRESRRNGDNLVRNNKESSFNDHHHYYHHHNQHDDNNGLLRRRSSSDYRRNDREHDEKRLNKPRESSLKRNSSRDRQLFRKISFNLRSKDKKRDTNDKDSEKELTMSNLRRDDRHSRPLTPPTTPTATTATGVNDLRVDDDDTTVTVTRSRKILLSKDYRDDCPRNNKMFDHNNRNSRDLSWIDKELSWYSSEESPDREKIKKNTIDRDDSDQNFSTIERNGTTVIRIRTSSQSPVRSIDRQFQCRRIRDVSMERRNEYEEEDAGDERDDDEEENDVDDDDNDDVDDNGDMDEFIFSGRRRRLRRDSFQSRDFHDSSVQITDLEDGQPCLHCGETCPGFSPHTWRKNCTRCKCPKEAHDVCHEEWVSVRARLGLKGDGPNNYIGFEPRERGLAWAPPGLPPNKVEEYFSMLPEISVPRLGTPGERHRDRQLATQLPKQDLARAYCRHLDTEHASSADDFMAARNEIALDIGSVQEVVDRGHECGVCHEPLKFGSMAVMASKLGILYHPACFQCAQCHELLVDLAYCVHDDVLYCERHYAERLKPRCAACDELIFSGEYTKAMNKDWHSGHFCCWQCDESLTGQRYVLRDEHPYCIKCYESVFANGCEECNKIIGIDSKDLSYKDKHWHEACFLCNKCRVSLVDKQFGSKVDKIYCGNCYDAQFASRCDGCGEIFRAGTKKMEYKTRQWHEKCFCCVVCKNPIGTKSFIPREQEIYCAGCYEDKFATRCVKCNKIITSGGVTYKNEPWHRDCFTCSHCNNSLAGQRFTSRDDKPYCAECFGELFAKRCTACTKPITGIGGTRFISFEDRHWHNDCFICAGCNTSLVGRGFITDGDDIICPECAKQKLSE